MQAPFPFKHINPIRAKLSSTFIHSIQLDICTFYGVNILQVVSKIHKIIKNEVSLNG